MDRRAFLRRAGTATVGLGATALIGATTASAHGGPPNWRALARALTGSLVLPRAASYPTDTLLYNQALVTHPAAIAYCATPTDVQRCVVFARDHGVPLAARSGGHSYGGYSSCRGLVIDVSPLHAMTVGPGPDSPTGTAVVGAGAKLLDLYRGIGAHGVLLPGGSCPSVGIAGLALGGGIGVFGRAYGLTCDRIASLQMVTADGTLRTCAPGHHPDLYWASRGGGGGNFGVVTSFTFSVEPIPAVNLFTLVWPWAAATTVLEAWLSFTSTAPDELWSNCQLLSIGRPGTGQVKVTGVFAGTTAACAAALAPLHRGVGSSPSSRFVGPEEFLRAMLIEAGCEGTAVAECQLTPSGTLARSPFAAKSSFVNAPMGAAGSAAVVDAVSRLVTEVPGVGGGIVFDGYGGAINRIAPGDTAFVHRRSIACAQYSVSYATAPPSPSASVAAHAWLAQVHQTFAPYAQGSYQNYIDPTQSDWARAYYGANLPRLIEIKRRHDPTDLFHFAQSIPLSVTPTPGPPSAH
jgi:FAD/FMN-containing dehydrogenase